MTPGTIEYIISQNGGPEQSSGVLDIENDWLGIPDGTLISLRAQNLSTAAAAPDFATTTFSNFDFDGPNNAVTVPEAATAGLLVTALAVGIPARRAR